jgi:hypothetical protein
MPVLVHAPYQGCPLRHELDENSPSTFNTVLRTPKAGLQQVADESTLHIAANAIGLRKCFRINKIVRSDNMSGSA